MNWILKLALFATLMALTLGHLKGKSANKFQNKTMTVDENHFVSNTTKEKTFTIQESKVNKPLVTTISPKKKGDPYKNPVTLTLKSGSEKVTCNLKSYEDLCVLEKVPVSPSYLTVQCRDLPCDVEFVTSQSPLLQTVSEQKLDELYKLEQTVKHHVMMFSCDDPDVVNYQSMLRVYTNVPYTKTSNNNMIYYLFTSTKDKGYMLVESDQKARRCTTMSVSKTPSKLQNGVMVRDFATKDITSFDLEAPKNMDLRFDLSYHDLEKEKIVKSTLTIELFGTNSTQKYKLHTFTIQNLDNKTTVISDVVFPNALFSLYPNLSIQMSSSESLLLITMIPSYAKIHDVDVGETSLFTLRSGDTLSYRLQAEPKNDDSRVEIQLINDNNHAQVSAQTCSIREGCQFKVTAKGDINQAGLKLKPLSQTTKGNTTYITINSTYSGKIREGQILYFVHNVAKKTDLQIMVNSPNVLIYAADKTCPKPSQTCNNYSGNEREQIQIQKEYLGDIYIAIQGLDNSRFTLTIIQNSQYFIQLKDGEPFSYTLKRQNEIGFTFKIKNHNSDVKFNLVAPLNSLHMYVNNDAEEISTDNANLRSYSGDVIFKKSDLKSNDFTLLLSKVHNTTISESVHFVIIASTNNSILPLQPSIPHYEQLLFHEPVKFILEYERKSSTLLNIFVTQVTTDDHIPLILKVVSDLKDLPNSAEIQIKKSRKTVDLQEYGQKLCKSTQIDYCQLYIELVNNGDTPLDITLTLLSRDAIVELKDGFWESFPIKEMTSSFHFYFMPKHQNNSINIIYKTTFKHLELVYKLWKISKQKMLNMEDWPFPANDIPLNKTDVYNPMQSISISADHLTSCWPNCVVLFSFAQLAKSNDTRSALVKRLTELDHFSILASNDMISLIERQKIQLVLHKDQEKQLIIDLKHILDKEHITFFSYTIIGQVKIFASLSSNKQHRRPTQTDFDHSFGQLETQINIGKLKDMMNSLNMQNDQEVYLKLVVFPEVESKITFEYSTKQNKIKQLHFQSFETLKLQPNQEKMLQLIPTSEYKLKIIRVKGFPFMTVKECDNKNLNDCMEEMTGESFKQMTSKTEEHQGAASTSKLVVVKIQAKQECEIDIYAQTPFSEIELKEGQIVTDFALANQTVRYSITGIRLKETVLTFNVLEGNPTVRVYDFDGVNISRTKKSNGLIHIPIPPKAKNTSLATNFGFGFGLNSFFSTLHVTVTDDKTNTFYTVQYTSGDRGLMMQDGLLTSVAIQPNHNITLFFHNSALQEEPIVIITGDTAEELKDIQIKISYTDAEGEGEEMKVTTPEFKPKTPRPTMLFRLPKGYADFQIFLTNQSPKVNASITVVINQDEILVLPYFIEYPVILKEGESQNLMTEINNQGFLVLTVKKCDTGVPTIAYSFDRESFNSQDFMFQSQIREQMRAEYFIKGSPGTLYIKVQADVASSFSISLKFYTNKSSVPKDVGHPGNHGMLEYQLVNSVEAEISFYPVKCDKQCPPITYSYMAGTSMQSVYSQSLCPSYFFTYSQQNKPLQSIPIKISPANSSVIKFSYKLIDQISYVAVKATMQDGREHVYKPVQIVTIWGHIARNRHYHIFFLFLTGGLILCAVLMCVRRWTKPQYKRLTDEIQ